MSLIGCDVDGVVADLTTAWLARYNKDWNDDLVEDDMKSWGFHLYVKPECGNRIYEYLADRTLYDDVKPYDGALEFIQELRANGHKVFFVTSTPPESGGVKYFWLKNHGFIKDVPEYVEARNKTLIRADWLVDDYYGNTSSFIGKTVLIARPWNQGHDNRCFSYVEAIRIINSGKEKEVLWKKA